MKKLLAIALVLAVLAAGTVAFRARVHRADPAEMLARSNLDNTSVTYSWAGGYHFENCDVHADFSGDGQATLTVGDGPPVRVSISDERYRRLIACMAQNDFSRVKVKRRWGLYQCDIGETTLSADQARRYAMSVQD